MSTTEPTDSRPEQVPPPPPIRDDPNIGEFFDRPKPKSKRRWLWPLAAIAALFVGIAIGGAGGSSPADPEVRTVTETETVTEIVVPDVCLAALDDADALTQIAAEFGILTSTALGLASEGFIAVSNFDVAELERINAEMLAVPDQIDALTAQVEASTYQVNRDACRATQ